MAASYLIIIQYKIAFYELYFKNPFFRVDAVGNRINAKEKSIRKGPTIELHTPLLQISCQYRKAVTRARARRKMIRRTC
jgi:hypothetical protein